MSSFLTWECSRCKKRETTGDVTAPHKMPDGWAKLHRYVASGSLECAPSDGYVYDFCDDCIQAFESFMQGANPGESDLRYKRSYACSNGHVTEVIEGPAVRTEGCLECGAADFVRSTEYVRGPGEGWEIRDILQRESTS